jgi:hypothetical protein
MKGEHNPVVVIVPVPPSVWKLGTSDVVHAYADGNAFEIEFNPNVQATPDAAVRAHRASDSGLCRTGTGDACRPMSLRSAHRRPSAGRRSVSGVGSDERAAFQ